MPNKMQPGEPEQQDQLQGRRDFLRWSGVGAAAIFAAACDQDATRTITGVRADTTRIVRTDTIIRDPQNPSNAPAVTLNFANDFGVLNFAFALEQLEAAFYTQVVASANFNSTFSEAERRVLIDLRDHEVIHREFLRTAITALAPANTIIGNLTPQFASINFNSRESVLTTARTFEDLGVAAYNGAARFLQSADLLLIAGKIVSVEARHAAAIRDLLNPRANGFAGNAFAPHSFDQAMRPSRVLAAADPFIQNPVNVTNTPSGF